ncbi:MAG: GNAT family N-acetyltransferase [Eudoraea sp.]|nr:GNAT family N-acetyltransferase [Eudoraea sp.]MBT8222077.1 GNAT family N-acetyltransferase [Eudoraea sp.]
MSTISLRPLTPADTEILARLANNKKIWDGVRDHFPFPYTLDDALDFIDRKAEEVPAYTFAIINQEDNLCGVISLVPQEDVYRRSAEIGYWIGEPFWRKGLATQAISLMTRYGFEELQLERIFAAVFDFNLASMRALEKNGYQKEGIFRKALVKNDQICDEHRYAKLKKE